MNIRKVIRLVLMEGIGKEYSYLGQCDVLRKATEGEKNWHGMMNDRKPISVDEFLNSCDLSPICDEDETPEEWVMNCYSSDSETGTYASNWNSVPCMFIQTAGFEFIFIRKQPIFVP